MKTLILLAALAYIPVPQPDPTAIPPVSIDDAAEFCNAAGGYWNEYSAPDNSVSWFECDEVASDDGWNDLDVQEQCDALDGTLTPDGCLDEEGNVYDMTR